MSNDDKIVGLTDRLSGFLESPYGCMMVGDEVSFLHVPNGYPVKNEKLVGISFKHFVPKHWIRTDNAKVSGDER